MGKKHFFFPDRRLRTVALGATFFLLLSLLGAVTVAQALAQDSLRGESPLVLLLGSCLPFSLLALLTMRWDAGRSRRPVIFSAGFWLTSLTVLLVVAGLGFWFRASQPVAIPLALFLFSSVTLSAGGHWLAGAVSLAPPKRILFIGDDPLIAELIQLAREKPHHACEIVDPWPDNEFLESSDGLLKKISQLNVKHIVYSDQAAMPPQIVKTLLEMKFTQIPLYDAASYYQKLTGALPIQHLDGRTLLASNRKEVGFPSLAAILKRTVDIFFTLLLLPLALPLLLISALAIKLDSRGPILFIQERLGLGGKPFKIVKLRTMVVDAEKNAPQWCKDNDPRITRVGKILRKLRLDELPQLLNVLKNDMSLVGPRPIRQHFTVLLAQEVPFYRLRLLAKPGLTGWAQVHAGHANTMAGHAKMLQYDLFYLIHQSLWLDLVILFKTIRTILLGKGR